jgi:hypothetical protein
LQERHVALLDGTPIFIRPLKPDDGALYPDFLADVTSDDLRLRFFAPMREVNPKLIDKLIHYDPAKAMQPAACSASCACTMTLTETRANSQSCCART